MTRVYRWWLIGIAAAAASVAGAAVSLQPITTIAVVAGLFVLTLCFSFAASLPRLFLTFLCVCLIGYGFIGKGFAYLGVPPLYVGEMALACGLLAAAFTGGIGPALRSPLSWLMIGFAFWGFVQTVPYVGTYKLDALRDATLWGYSAFALLVVTMLTRTGLYAAVPEVYWRWFRWLPYWVPIAGVISRLGADVMPRVPGTDIPILYFKAGDSAVHAGGIAAFCLVGLAHFSGRRTKLMAWAEYPWWGAWLAGLVVSASASRGGFLSALTAIFTVLVLRPHTRWWKPAVVGIVFAAAFVASDVEIDLGLERKVSAEQLLSNFRSIAGGDKEKGDLGGTRAWRIQWWTDIAHYTVYGKYFWTGKGFGINLADDDGYQGTVRGLPNRSPHNVQMTVLARAGVPGLLLWSVLQLGFGIAMIRGYFRARRAGQEWWARVNLWVLAYWLAFMVNAAFDVFLEGPQGGIWFWSLMGFGMAALEAQRQPSGRAELADSAGGASPTRPEEPRVLEGASAAAQGSLDRRSAHP